MAWGEDVKALKTPVLIITGDSDVATLEHSVAMFRLLGAGVNLVTGLGLSLAHAEMIALSLAQNAAATWNLGAGPRAQLVTSCEPCAMCLGAVPWSGVSSLVWGARREDAEAAGFDEGDKPGDWIEALERRGIRTRAEVLREEAAAVLARYASRNGVIYHPTKS